MPPSPKLAEALPSFFPSLLSLGEGEGERRHLLESVLHKVSSSSCIPTPASLGGPKNQCNILSKAHRPRDLSLCQGVCFYTGSALGVVPKELV